MGDDLSLLSPYAACVVAGFNAQTSGTSGIFGLQTFYNCTNDKVTFNTVSGAMFGTTKTSTTWNYTPLPDCISRVTVSVNSEDNIEGFNAITFGKQQPSTPFGQLGTSPTTIPSATPTLCLSFVRYNIVNNVVAGLQFWGTSPAGIWTAPS